MSGLANARGNEYAAVLANNVVIITDPALDGIDAINVKVIVLKRGISFAAFAFVSRSHELNWTRRLLARTHIIRHPWRRYIIFTAALFVISSIPASKYFFDSLYDIRMVRRPSSSNEITIVTMYINIGQFRKGREDNYHTPALYQTWMTTWGWLSNRVVAFFDNDTDLETFRKIRSSQPSNRTILIKLERTEIPAFRDLEKIEIIFKHKLYPKHLPNTVYAEYSCAMNAKYDALQMAIYKDLVQTEHMAWLDIGLFRNLVEPNHRPKDDHFTLDVPENFNSSTVGMSAVESRSYMSSLSPWDYINYNQVWVSGAFVLATKEVMWKFSESYKMMVSTLLDQGMASTDQQVIGAMYSPEYIEYQLVSIQDYNCYYELFSHSVYFCLGYICKEAAEKRLKAHRTAQMKNII